MNNIKVKEVTVSLSGVIPVAAYENLRPGFSMTVELIDGQDVKKVITECQQYLHSVFEAESNRGKADLIDKQYSNIRFYEKDGKKYPSVTSIIGWDKEWKVTEDELRQYASRGTIVGEIVEHYLSKGEWIDPTQVPSLREDVSVLMSGSLMFTWEQCSHKAFLEQFGDKIKVENVQGTVFNDENLYAGTYDIFGSYESVKSLMDVKCGGYNMMQLAAYAMCLEGVQQLVVLPVGPTDNKCGYKKPVVCDTIGKEFEEFLKVRAKFRKRFGV